MHFSITDLKLFVNIVEMGSITKGAEKSFLAVSAASTRIRNLESSLGAPLLIRTGRGIELTPAGKTLLHHSHKVIKQLHYLQGDLMEHTNRMKGYVRLLANTNALTEFLPELLTSFLAAQPQVSIDLQERSSSEIVEAVAEGNADIGIFAGSDEVPDIECFPFRIDKLVLVVSREHPLRAQQSIALEDCLDFEFVGLRQASAIQTFLVDMAARTGRELKIRVRLDSFDAICSMAAHNIGIGIVPSSSAHRCARLMDIDIIPLTNKWAVRQLNVAVSSTDKLSPQAMSLYLHLRNAAEPGLK